MPGGVPTTSVVVSTYDDRRWKDLAACVESLQDQTIPPEVIVVVDHNDDLLDRVRAEFPAVTVVANHQSKGLAGARNSGVAAASGEIVAFIDDDAQAEPQWLERLRSCFDEPNVVAAGGALIPLWSTVRPGWFPDEFLWTVGCTYAGLPEEVAPIRNPIGANMALRREVIEQIGGFQAGVVPRELRHNGVVAAGGHAFEDTDIGIRAVRTRPRSICLYEPAARVHHSVTPERATLGYFVRRCYEEGNGKARLAHSLGPQEGLSSERRYVSRVLPLGVLRGLRDLFRGDPYGPARSAVILLGLVTTGVGFLGCAIRLKARG